MKDKSIPLFLERRSYRQRRLMDAARLLPLLGALLWMVPLLWPRTQTVQSADAAAVSTSSAILYMFAVWIFLALAALFLSVMLDTKAEAQDSRDD
ncbi:hypothetical protein ABWH93_19445 [Seohaeicola saemankumensis]|jgi:hypothetical protein|uniref:hypothetical protein n=1 Tax=Seohaeicola TaxID=481178 RepID=UPI0007F45887|nr:hypothetical protein [Paracoccaceae bacterium]OAN69155.1 hypothetical protein A8B83_16575 [Rhodobacteraceae bacterium EhC02]